MHAKVTNAWSINLKEERLGSLKCIWEDTIKMDLKNRVYGTELDSSGSKQEPVASFYENG